MKIILLGAPGAGKGTQAEVICNRYNIPAISTGNIIREALKTGTEMGLKAKSYMESGALVPDEVVIGIIKERIVKDDCKDGFILDGFPRTIPQAEALDKMGIVIDKVVDIEVPDEKIINRMSGRRVCEKCGASYHLEYKSLRLRAFATLAQAPLFNARMTILTQLSHALMFIIVKQNLLRITMRSKVSSQLLRVRKKSRIQLDFL